MFRVSMVMALVLMVSAALAAVGEEADLPKSGQVGRESGGTYWPCYGKAIITKIKMTERSRTINAKYVKYEGYEVFFQFKLDHPLEGADKETLDRVNSYLKKEWPFMLNERDTFYFAGPKYIKKYGLKVGNEYPCEMFVQTEGGDECDYGLKGLENDLFEKEDVQPMEKLNPIKGLETKPANVENK